MDMISYTYRQTLFGQHYAPHRAKFGCNANFDDVKFHVCNEVRGVQKNAVLELWKL